MRDTHPQFRESLLKSHGLSRTWPSSSSSFDCNTVWTKTGKPQAVIQGNQDEGAESTASQRFSKEASNSLSRKSVRSVKQLVMKNTLLTSDFKSHTIYV